VGFYLISGVDNVVRPMLIRRGLSLSFLLTLLGVLNSVIAFGFVGFFIGYSLMNECTHTKNPILRHLDAQDD
jgi:predicted PurR-regulated permease PerM